MAKNADGKWEVTLKSTMDGVIKYKFWYKGTYIYDFKSPDKIDDGFGGNNGLIEVSKVTARKGYKTGLTIKGGLPDSDTGGGMCQFTNLIHWLVLHSPLTICEHHHHDGVDLFPDFGRVVPFGTGTSILYNYKDYRFRNDTPYTFQLLIATDEEYITGKLLCSHALPHTWHIQAEDEFFSREDGEVYRNGKVYRKTVDVITGRTVERQLIKVNHARVLYDTEGLSIRES